MNSKIVNIIIIINLLACIALVFWYPQLMISPGALLEEHQELTTDCFACHTPFRGSSSEKCMVCHSVDDIGLVTTKGVKIQDETPVSFHQHLKEPDCVACHADHQGMKVYRSIQHFSHDLLALPVQNNCDSCHQKPTDSIHQKLTGNCEQCHSETQWQPALFDHDKYFRFDRHHEAECVKCHLNHDYSQYSCYECHEHSPSKIRSEHREEGIFEYDNCTECHRSGDEDEAERIWKSKRHELRNNNRSEQSESRRYHDDDDDKKYRRHHDDDEHDEDDDDSK
jgi:hypothetical protein